LFRLALTLSAAIRASRSLAFFFGKDVGPHLEFGPADSADSSVENLGIQAIVITVTA
jgi:hypothetical protein